MRSVIIIFFFFSSRRRHTRCGRDWSSDVCSSDLVQVFPLRPTSDDSVTVRQRRPSVGGVHDLLLYPLRHQKGLPGARDHYALAHPVEPPQPAPVPLLAPAQAHRVFLVVRSRQVPAHVPLPRGGPLVHGTLPLPPAPGSVRSLVALHGAASEYPGVGSPPE